jgi:ATP/ADP translocase
MLFYFFFVVHVVMVKSASNALFLSRHNPQYLAVLYIFVAVFVALITLFAAKMLADPRRRILRLLLIYSVASVLILCWGTLRFDIFPVSPFLYLFCEVSATAINLQFWAVAGDIFEPQESKRVFGLLAGGGMAGSIVGGLLVNTAGMAIGTVNLVAVAAGVLLFCVITAQQLAKHQGRTDALPVKEKQSLRKGFRYVLTDSYPKTFGLLMLISSVLTSFVDYYFRISAQSRLQEDQLVALFGQLNFFVGVISAVFLLFFSGRILRRIGIFNYLGIVPIGMVFACVLSIISPMFFAVYVLKIIENSGSLSINQAGFQLLYNPVRTALRAPTRGVIDGFIKKLGFAIGGILILAFTTFFTHLVFEVITIVLLVIFIALLVRMRKLYVSSLDAKIRIGVRKVEDLQLEDGSTQRVLLQALHSGDDDLIKTSLSMLANIPSADIRTECQMFLESKSEKVQICAINAVGERGYKDFLFDLLGIINSGSRRARAAAVRAVAALDTERADGALIPYLQSDDPGLVAVAIEELINLRGYSRDNPAIEVLERLLENDIDATAGERRETARLLGRLGQEPYISCLDSYLQDPDPSVRRIAAKSAQLVCRLNFVPLLLNMLSDRETRGQAREALAAYGDRVVGVLREWLDDRSRPIEVRLRIPRVLRMIGTQRASEVLLFSNIQDDALLRYRIALALSGIRLQNKEIKLDRRWAYQAVDRRLESYDYYAKLYQPLAGILSVDYLIVRLLQDRLLQNIEVAFRTLALLYHHGTIMNIFYRLKDAKGETWWDAMELLDNVVSRETRDQLFPILENHRTLLSTSTILGETVELAMVSPVLNELSESRDPLLRAAAINTRCQLGDDCAHLYPELVKGMSTVNIMEKVLFLESVNIFKQNNMDDLTALAAITTRKTFKPGEHILREGHPGEALYIITKGQAEIIKNGKKLIQVEEKGSLGSVSLLDREPHAADAIAVTKCETLVIERTSFMDLVADRVELLHGIFLALTDRLRKLLAVTDEGALVEEGGKKSNNPI